MLERFAQTARQAVVDARLEAELAGQDRVRSEHLLVSLLREPGPGGDALTAAGLDAESLRARLPRGDREVPGGLNADALALLGIDLDAVRRATDAAFGRGALERARPPGRGRLPFAPEARHTLAGAARQAQHLSHRQITSGHLLLGILDQKDSGALNLLAQAGADIPALRAEVLRRMGAAA